MKAEHTVLAIGIVLTGLSGSQSALSFGRTELPIFSRCGDGWLDTSTGEECDDGNTNNGDGCDSDCDQEIPPVCGDGILNQPNEACDDANTTNGDGCENNCLFTTPTKCPGSQCVTRVVHATACHYHGDDAGSAVMYGGHVTNSGSTRGFYCWLNSDTSLAHGSARFLWVDGFQASGTVTKSRACTRKYNQASSSCGPYKPWGTGDFGSGSVSVTGWNSDPNGMPYIHTLLAAGGTLRGFFFNN